MQVPPYTVQSLQQIFSNHGTYHDPTVLDSYFSTLDGKNFNSLSRGSSLSHPQREYQHFSDRGDLSTSLSPSSLAGISQDTITDMAITKNISSGVDFFCPEDITECWQQWKRPAAAPLLHGLPVPVAAPPHEDSLAFESRVSQAMVVCSHAAQLPTPAAMAVLLNPNGLSDIQTPQVIRPPPVRATTLNAITRSLRAVKPEYGMQNVPDILSPMKKYACTMCHKRFDRPSTLRKHFLVHTGEKAFVCQTCGRRFGVASNLNRHTRKCSVKPVITMLTSSTSPSTAVASPNTSGCPVSAGTAKSQVPQIGRQHQRHGVRDPSPTSSDTFPSSSSNNNTLPQQAQACIVPKQNLSIQKRRRRAPSPLQWIPCSLLSFNLMPPEFFSATPVPLPPVRQNLPLEERDSWDENAGHTPYHPCGWKDVLPGPGLGQGLGLGGKPR